MAQYDMPRENFESNIGNSNISEGTKQSIDQLFANQDNVVVSDYDPNDPPVNADVVIVPEGTEVTGDPGGSVVIFQGAASGNFDAGGGDRAFVAQSDDSQNLNITGTGNVTVETGAGNDAITVDPTVAVTVDTGEGFDQINIGNARGDHGFTVDGDGNVVISGSSYTLANTDVVQFSDGISVMADDEEEAIIGRMYQVLFGREADVKGLNFWFDAADSDDYDLTWITSAFMDSEEYDAKYAEMSDIEFIEEMYLNLSGRTPDDEGAAYWLDVLAQDSDDFDAYLHVFGGFAYSEEAAEVMGAEGSKYVIELFDDDDEVA